MESYFTIVRKEEHLESGVVPLSEIKKLVNRFEEEYRGRGRGKRVVFLYLSCFEMVSEEDGRIFRQIPVVEGNECVYSIERGYLEVIPKRFTRVEL